MKAQKFETSLTLSHSIEIVNEPSSYVPLEPLPTKVGISRGTEKQTVFPTSTTQQWVCTTTYVYLPSSSHHHSTTALIMIPMLLMRTNLFFFSLPHFTTYFMGFSLFLFSTHFLAYFRQWEIFSHNHCVWKFDAFSPRKILLNYCRFFSYCKIAELKRIFKVQKSICKGFF